MAKKRAANPIAVEPQASNASAKAEWKVENVVATVVVELGASGEKINLNQLAHRYPDCEYNPERFPGLVMRVVDPKATILIFSTGKMVVTGLRAATEAEAVVNNVVKKMVQAKVDIKSKPVITIQNIVASGDLHTHIDLNEASVIMENAMYEPEVFPGLIYRMAEPKTVFLIFSTGRIVCTGAKTKEIVGEAVQKLVQQVKEYELDQGKGEGDLDGNEALDFI